MFCSKCGKQISDEVSFCEFCGNRVGEHTVVTPLAGISVDDYQTQFQSQYHAQKNAIRQSEIQNLEKVIKHFADKEESFDAYDLVSDMYDRYNRNLKIRWILWVAGVIFLVGWIGFFTRTLVGGVIWLTSCGLDIFLMLVHMLRRVNHKRKRENYTESYTRLSEELYNCYLKYPECPVGREYVNPKILRVIMGILQSGRVDTIKEAINIILQENANKRYVNRINAFNAEIMQENEDTKIVRFYSATKFFGRR